uniref:NAB domain-containing protein n=1 Tax=Davidia involucrata TaxID=16924 RepID=A0A5B7CEU1_DAVIN
MEGKMRTEKAGAAMAASNQSRIVGRFCKPSWLLSIISDLEEGMKMLALNLLPEEDIADNTFAQRAEAYYRERPQLLALLQDLYNGYISLADRYSETLAKQQQQRSSHQIPFAHFDVYCGEEDENGSSTSSGTGLVQVDSDAESSLSYQPLIPGGSGSLDEIVAELVMKSVEYDMMVHEVEQRWRKTDELQKSLLEVLESERLILLNENARLGYRVTALVEENKGLASESLFIKRKAGELARCVLKMKEDRMLSHKIEDLQGQIYGLEKRNKEYYQQLLLIKRDHHQPQEENNNKTSTRRKKKQNVGVEHGPKGGSGRRGSKWWDRVKNFDLFLPCGPHPNFICC